MTSSIVLFDLDQDRKSLLPLTATRPLANLRVGLCTIDHKWKQLLASTISYATVDYLQEKFPIDNNSHQYLYINGSVLPSVVLVEALKELNLGDKLVTSDGKLIAFICETAVDYTSIHSQVEDYTPVTFTDAIDIITKPEDIFKFNASQIEFDYQHILSFEQNAIDDFSLNNKIIGNEIYIAETACVNQTYLDASQGPIYISENVVIEPGTVLYGPIAIGAYTRIKSGTVIYPNVTIGPNSTVGGEINNVVIWGNSAKGHDGYLGCAVIGEGCNIGAGTSNSNLKNDWSTVKLYDYSIYQYRDTGISKCGVIMGDHVMLSIHSKINTGTVIGVGTQIAISEFIPKFVPDYSWFTDLTKESYIYERFVNMLERKSVLKCEYLSDIDLRILREVYEQTTELRNY